MDFLKEFNRLMEESKNIALATSKDNLPNVRILSYSYDAQNQGVIYFLTFKGTQKTIELEKNKKVSFTTIPDGTSEVIRVADATVNKCEGDVDKIKSIIIKKFPEQEGLISSSGHILDFYEIKFNEANVILGPNKTGKVTL
ncbi:pyridoxamine 5'-phosphate oxidase family protein [Clostridium sp. 'White wine YQ']|uniref:pyridoxamine 5'-phosphate oxidase family protein n=1 Tax=Clostridium sp. 'White wine YQ' TaxID=3027474 RepID=UPI0023655224|nr:pyridoxamine 5'-phosphate oxidase family protein [Clostridium sp. 'White wine YQ']MDD7795344.1 pyridoxamine 5'-phosphate oxidase family protein [Clostridium sp. 'White wine YQ']